MGSYQFFDLKPQTADARQEVLAGLRAEEKYVSPKFFYDEQGSLLFEQITQLPEYYLTRTEMRLFDDYASDIADAIGHGGCIVEYGSGSNRKIRKLLQNVEPDAYAPVDISTDHLQANARALHRDHPGLNVYAVCADYSQPLELPRALAGYDKTAFFPGSSIGNFEPTAAETFLGNVRTTLGKHGSMLVGVDRKKDSRVLEAAYNDNQGVTAAFNKNLLTHINDELNADFDVAAFEHRAEYDPDDGCIRMYLISQRDQRVRVGDAEFEFAQGERLHTESSYKYDPAQFSELSARAGFRMREMWSDANELFAVFLLQRE